MNIELLLKNKLNFLFSSCLKIRNYILIYIISVIFLSLSFLNTENYLNPNAEIILLLIISFFGIITIIYSFLREKELHNIGFLIILVFGILTVFINPTLIACDENEHFARSEMTSSGILIPEYIEEKGYSVHNLFYQLDNHRGETFLGGDFINEKISSENSFYSSGYPQNPFYGYIAQAIGILIAKFLDLSVIWIMWIGRLFNLLLYGIIIRFAIKKAPVYKMPLLLVACLPMAIYQAASFSIDPFINGFAILAISYFIFIYKTPFKIKKKDISIFFIAILLIGLIKIPYVLLVLLILLIPKEKFESKNTFIISRIIPIAIILISMIYSYLYASNQLYNSERDVYFIQNNVSSSDQINYILNNPFEAIILFLQIGNTIPVMINDIFTFSHMDWIYASRLLSFFYLIFFGIFSLIYPTNIDIGKNNKIKILILVLIIYIGTFFIQYLTWTPVGLNEIQGVFARYFIPLLVLIPLIVNVGNSKLKNNLTIISFIVIFLAGTLILTVSKFY
ncbi:MAG: DUF2142 domain-containing protein [Methanobacteriaceae archaeon]|jgi:uncharacterized membrane protein|nr:DUF2142 domain-containing protein [Methanobacteriaceae archaeon]